MAVLEYLDFDLLIEQQGQNCYRARVLNSPAGQASGLIQLPFSDLELENFLLRIGRPRRGVRRLESPEMEAAKIFGGKLFKSIFDDELMSALRSSLDEARKQERGLRIRLRLNDAPELVNLPWEYLYNPALNRFLTLSVMTPVVRYLELPEQITPLAVKPPLRMLAMIANPSDYPGLDVEREWHNLKTALAGLEARRLLKLDRLEKATPVELQYQLRKAEYHIFHFVGHGGFHEQAQDGILLLEDESGRGRPLSGQFLGTVLHDERSLRLVVLNACEGARSGRTDPFAGVAQSMVQQGIPAVIAMQFEITDEAAITFAREFYTAVAEGYPVDAGLAEARKVIYSLGNDIEWGTPVLYMRATQGHIFTLPKAKSPKQRVPARYPIGETETNQWLEQVYAEANQASQESDWEKARDCFQAILDQYPDHPTASARLLEAKHQIESQKLQVELEAVYRQAVEEFDAGRWQEALDLYNAIQKRQPAFPDREKLRDRIATEKSRQEADRYRKNQAVILYKQARDLVSTAQWQRALANMQEVQKLDPRFDDIYGLLSKIQQAMAREEEEKQRQTRLVETYAQADKELAKGNWQGAKKLYDKIITLQPINSENANLLKQIEDERSRQEANRTREFQIAALYKQAGEQYNLGLWRQASDKMQEILRLDAGFKDPEKLWSKIQDARSREEARQKQRKSEAEAQEKADRKKKEELAALYAEAVRLLEDGQLVAALAKWNDVKSRDGAYPDEHNVEVTVTKRSNLIFTSIFLESLGIISILGLGHIYVGHIGWGVVSMLLWWGIVAFIIDSEPAWIVPVILFLGTILSNYFMMKFIAKRGEAGSWKRVIFFGIIAILVVWQVIIPLL